MTRLLDGLVLGLLLAAHTVDAGPLPFDLQLNVPPVVADSKAPKACTVTYMIADIANNDLYAARMRIEPAETDAPVQNRLPCPADIRPRVGMRALDVCTSRTGEAKDCVFADMSPRVRAAGGYPQHGGQFLTLRVRHCERYRRGVLDVGQFISLQRGVRDFPAAGSGSRPCALRGKAAAALPYHGERTSFWSMNRFSACATAMEWLICALSFRWSCESKKALRG